VEVVMRDEQSDGQSRLQIEKQRLLESLRDRGIASEQVLNAMASVPREAFVEQQYRHLAYDDNALPIGLAQTISQPTIVAMMTTALQLEPDNIVLEIGTGSGYQAAVIAQIARRCISIEIHAELAKRAVEALASLGIINVEVIVGDGSAGYPALAPYDRILVTAAAPEIPERLLNQLSRRPGSRIVAPVGDQRSQALMTTTWTNEGWVSAQSGTVRFVPLRGEAGWSDTEWKHD
jgi:protein-L-isoaspartate(D-aspartate) O-methyltransferase